MVGLKEILVDVRELEAPQPLVEVIQALQTLHTDSYIKILHRMRPCRVYDIVKEKNLCEKTVEKKDKDEIVMYIYHPQNKENVWFLQDLV